MSAILKLLAPVGLVLALAPAQPVLAHGGGLNAQGCHNQRSTGGYHCHRSPQAAAPTPRAQPLLSSAFANCDAARAAGAAPVLAGEPGYGSHLDRDGDGIGCESSGGSSGGAAQASTTPPASPPAAVPSSQLNDPDMTLLANTDLPGGDIDTRGVRGVTFAECQAICLANSQCVAVSWVEDSAWCWPKAAVVDQQTATGIMSALRD